MNKQALDIAMQTLPDWSLITTDSLFQLQRCFTFNNFVEAMQLAQQIARFAEEEEHHPSLLVEWGKLTVRWWTHDKNGITPKDFACATHTDIIFNAFLINQK